MLRGLTRSIQGARPSRYHRSGFSVGGHHRARVFSAVFASQNCKVLFFTKDLRMVLELVLCQSS